MEITFNNPTSKRIEVKVWQNDDLHTMHHGDKLTLNVKRGDVVKYKVGSLAATHSIDFVSNSAKFRIEQDKRTQVYGISIVMLLILAMFFLKLFENTVVSTVAAIAVLAIYEAFLYFRGYKATVIH